MLGSDYPFPLGEHHPGMLIESIEDMDEATKVVYFFLLLTLFMCIIQKNLLAGNALKFLGLDATTFTPQTSI